MLLQTLKKLYVSFLVLAIMTPSYQAFGAGQIIDEKPDESNLSSDGELAGPIIGSVIGGVAGYKLSNRNVDATILGTIFGALIGSVLQDKANDRALRNKILENEKAASLKALGENFDPNVIYNWGTPLSNQIPANPESGNYLVRGKYFFKTHGFYDGVYCREVIAALFLDQINIVRGHYCLSKTNEWNFFQQGTLSWSKYESFDNYAARVDRKAYELRKEARARAREKQNRPQIFWYCINGVCR